MYSMLEAVSLALTFITIQMCAEALFTWRKEAGKFFAGGREPWIWAGLGVVVHFSVSVLDNTYWGIAWSYKFAEHSIWPWWFANGVLSNIPFRQLGTAAAAFCYVRAAYLFHDKALDGVYTRMVLALVAGVVYVLILKP